MFHLSADSGLLQQVLLHLGPFDGSSLVEVDVDVFAETAGVVVPDGFGVAERCMGEDKHKIRECPCL